MPVDAVAVDVDDEAGLVGVGVDGPSWYPPLRHVLWHGLRKSSKGRLSVRCSMS